MEMRSLNVDEVREACWFRGTGGGDCDSIAFDWKVDGLLGGSIDDWDPRPFTDAEDETNDGIFAG